ncbi:LysR family transcriptional regulator [Caulobacter sp. KR2-114]|uniref:LysR family transcriptional regulator n=1 Tax=Caulobacter sp. KR2-114 TaxID=3400912 RepID=UPI003BFFDAF9
MRETVSEEEDIWRRLDWNDVRVFLAVAESGSLNAATRLLGMTQPTISRRMEDLEIRLGAQLFRRSTRGVQLTEAGQTMRDLAAGMARIGGSIVREVAGSDKNYSGRVILAAPDGMASYVLMPALSDFQAANPEIDLVLDCGMYPGSLTGGDVDLSLEFVELASADQATLPIAHLHYALYASRDYLNTYGAPKSLPDIANHRLVRHSAFREQRSTWNRRAEAMGELVGANLVTNSSAAMVEAIRAGAGLGSLPTAIHSVDPDLVMLDIEPVAHPTLWLRHHPAVVRHGRVQRVKEWLQRTFDASQRPWFRQDFIHPREFGRYTKGPGDGRAGYVAARRQKSA